MPTGVTIVPYNLASAQYGPQAQSFYAGLAKYQPSNGSGAVHEDGSFKTARRVGAFVPEHPFAQVGDRNATIIRARFLQNLASFKPVAYGTKLSEDARYYLIDECDFQDKTGGKVEWTRAYATIPAPHDEWDDYPMPYQYLFPVRPPTLNEKIIKVPCRIRTEFFHLSELSKYPILQKDGFEQFTDNIILARGRQIFRQQLGNFLVTDEAEIVAEDSEYEMWHYPIHSRKTLWVPGPTMALWGDTFPAFS